MIQHAKPLFLIGAPRSGTTILTKLLNAHPQIVLTNETAVFLQLDEIIRKSQKGVSAGILYGKTYHELWADLIQENSKKLIEEFYERITIKEKKSNIKYWGEKHPHLSVCLPFMTRLYENAVYIYIVRDPRDSACSIAKMNSVPVISALDSLKKFSATYEAFVEQLSSEQVLTIRYEDLVDDYVGTVKNILSFLNLELDNETTSFIQFQKNRDSHTSGPSSQKIIHFEKTSRGRWTDSMLEKEKEYAKKINEVFLRKYYHIDDETLRTKNSFMCVSDAPETKNEEFIGFECNICGKSNKLKMSDFDREKSSCSYCHSSVRTRSIIHLLSSELFGESLKLQDFPISKEIVGIGLSDWVTYAKKLEKIFSYTNTFYHKKPSFDICNPRGFSNIDFIISSEVFEHVVPPVERAFEGAYSILNDKGFLILTVPFMRKIKDTIEHFSDLYKYEIVKKDNGSYELLNTTVSGEKQVFYNLKFHGGPGQTLEMRIFSESDLLNKLETAGFSKIKIRNENCLKFGVVWNHMYSTPIVAHK